MQNTINAVFPSVAKEKTACCIVPEPGSPYLQDESRMAGHAEKVFFPSNEDEVAQIVRLAAAEGCPLTISGSRTGITGGAVPQKGWVVSTEKMYKCLGMRRDPQKQGFFRLRCQPGLTLKTLNAALAGDVDFPGAEQWPAADREILKIFRQSPPCWFPPDPTEQTASIGGMVACNASGARTFHYGPTRHYVTALRMVMADGAVIALERGACQADAVGGFVLVTAAGEKRPCRVPDYRLPPVKNAAGYYSAPQMDLLDLFIGAEGTLGIFTEVEVLLVPAPESILGAVAFFSNEKSAVDFVQTARTAPIAGGELLALEFFDAHALNLLREQKQLLGPSAPIPALPEDAHTAVYVEIATNEADLEQAGEALLALLEKFHSDPNAAWTAMDEDETIRLKNFRHALPEAVNQRIGARAAKYPGLTKLGTDFAVPDTALAAMLACYHAALQAAGFEYVIFGHIGNNHLHVNILPRDLEEYRQGKALYLKLAQEALRLGGTVSAEHGIGKLKKPLLELMFGAAGVASMRAIKNVFDPASVLNPGNVF